MRLRPELVYGRGADDEVDIISRSHSFSLGQFGTREFTQVLTYFFRIDACKAAEVRLRNVGSDNVHGLDATPCYASVVSVEAR